MIPAPDHDSTETRLRIGIFGGTFDPIHHGHVRTVTEVKTAFGLHTVFLVPAASPPHKTREDVADARDRLAMVLLAVADTPGLTVSDVELQRGGLSYTIDTVRRFRELLPESTALHFIIGIDAFLEIDSWKDFRRLFEWISFIVMIRPVMDAIDPNRQRRLLADFLSARIAADYAYDPACQGYRCPGREPVYLFPNQPQAISSTDIRARIRTGRAVHDLVPPQVAGYIAAKGLYR